MGKEEILFEEVVGALRELVSDFNRFGEVLQHGDNGEYGVESAIGRASKILDMLEAEHDPETCGCKYLGMNMWDCGHTDGEEMEAIHGKG